LSSIQLHSHSAGGLGVLCCLVIDHAGACSHDIGDEGRIVGIVLDTLLNEKADTPPIATSITLARMPVTDGPLPEGGKQVPGLINDPHAIISIEGVVSLAPTLKGIEDGRGGPEGGAGGSHTPRLICSTVPMGASRRLVIALSPACHQVTGSALLVMMMCFARNGTVLPRTCEIDHIIIWLRIAHMHIKVNRA